MTAAEERRAFAEWAASDAAPEEVRLYLWPLEGGDFYLPVPRGIYAGLYLCIRQWEGGTVSAESLGKQARNRELGILTWLCPGAANAQFTVGWYLEGRRNVA